MQSSGESVSTISRNWRSIEHGSSLSMCDWNGIYMGSTSNGHVHAATMNVGVVLDREASA